MPSLNDYFQSQYVDGGRGEIVKGTRCFDCWGLARSVRTEVYHLPLLPSWGNAAAENVRAKSAAMKTTVENHVEESAYQIGAIATVIWKELLLHVGVVVSVNDQLMIMETKSECGVRILSLKQFEEIYKKNNQRVVFYYDKNLSVTA